MALLFRVVDFSVAVTKSDSTIIISTTTCQKVKILNNSFQVNAKVQ